MGTSVLDSYESTFAACVGAPQAFAFWKGRVAAYAILKALGIGEGDEVVLPGYTCVMAVNPIVYLGARPVFVDIEPATYNLDPNQVEDKITPRTKLIIAQHTYGYPADMDALLDIAHRKGLPLIEDCCLSLGSKYKSRLTGTFGLAAYFSSQWNKPYTTGLGGMATVNDEELAGKIAELCERELLKPTRKEVNMLRAQLAVYRTVVYPRTTALAQNGYRLLTRIGLVVGSSSPAELAPQMRPDFFKGMSDLQARTGLRQLQRLPDNLDHRRKMAGLYDDLLRDHYWPMPRIPEGLDPVLVRYPVRVADKPKALRTAARNFVELGSWFECPLHPIETPMEAYGYYPGMCPQADRACAEVVNLPLHPRVDETTARNSVDFITGIGPAGGTPSKRPGYLPRHLAHARSSAAERGGAPAEPERSDWYIAPKPPSPKGWLVFSEEFVLRVLQGRYVPQLPARKTLPWRAAALVLRMFMAIAQFVLMFLALVPVVSAILELVAVYVRRGGMGFFLRSCYWKTKLRHLGQDTLIERGIEIWGARNIEIGSCCHVDTMVRLAAGEGRYGQCGFLSIGDYCHIGPRCHIAGRGGVEIGDFVTIEAGVHVYSATNTMLHPERPGQLLSFSHTAPHEFQSTVEAPARIGDYAMVGFDSLVMPGAVIGMGAIVHPYTQVIGEYPPFANIVGPGRSRQNGWRRPAKLDSRLKSTPADAGVALEPEAVRTTGPFPCRETNR